MAVKRPAPEDLDDVGRFDDGVDASENQFAAFPAEVSASAQAIATAKRPRKALLDQVKLEKQEAANSKRQLVIVFMSSQDPEADICFLFTREDVDAALPLELVMDAALAGHADASFMIDQDAALRAASDGARPLGVPLHGRPLWKVHRKSGRLGVPFSSASTRGPDERRSRRRALRGGPE